MNFSVVKTNTVFHGKVILPNLVPKGSVTICGKTQSVTIDK